MSAAAAPADFHSRGGEHHRAGRLQEAVSCYRQALDRDPECSFAWRHLGAALCQAGRYSEGADAFHRYIRLTPAEAAAHADLARALLAAGSPGAARMEYQRGLELDPTHVRSWLEQAAALEKLGDVSGAIAAYEQALVLQPAAATASALGYALLKAGAAEKSAGVFDEALEKWPDDALLHNGRGMALCALGAAAAALPSYEKAIGLDSSLAEAWYNRGVASPGYCAGFEALLRELAEPRTETATSP